MPAVASASANKLERVRVDLIVVGELQRPGFLPACSSFRNSASACATVALNSGESILVTAPQAQVKLVLFFTQAMDFRVVRPQTAHLMSIVLSCRAPMVPSLGSCPLP